MFVLLLQRIHRIISHPQWAWIGLWIGLAFLIVALVVMIRTSWGQSHPLRKCAGLSLLVHLLLAGYATTVQIVSGTGVAHRGGMNLLLIDGSDDGAVQGIDDPDASPDGAVGAGPTADAKLSTNDPSAAFANAAKLGTKVSTPPPLLDLPATKPPDAPAPEVAESKPETKPAAPENPPANETADTHPRDPPLLPSKPVDATHTEPSIVAAADSKPADKPSEPLPAANETAPVAQIPDPPSTSQVSDWTSGAPRGGNLPGQPALEGPLNEATRTPKADAASVNAVAEKPSVDNKNRVSVSGANGTGGPVVSGPVVESANPAIAGRAVPEIYSDRVASDRGDIVRRRGGSPEGESAVQAALHWLAENQSSDGRWDAGKFGAMQETAVPGRERVGAGGTGSKADTAVTGLALLAFLGAGNTHLHGDYAKNVQHGLEFLLSAQGHDGNMAGEAETYAFMYAHGIATLAMSEAYAMTGDKRLQGAVQSAIQYTLKAQIRATGGWRYQAVLLPGERGDTSQLGWQLMSLKSAELAGIDVPGSAGDGAIRFLKSVSLGQYGGKASYRPGERPSTTMTAEALVCRQFLGMARENPATDEAADYILTQLPNTQRINLYYWYYGTLGMYQLQDDRWQRWNTAMQSTLISRQHSDGELAGSWDPECIWGGYGGRVYSTALSSLCLEVYYRYLPIYRLGSRSTIDR